MAITKVTSGLISADAASVDLNIDAGTLYVDSTNNRVGIANTSPSDALDVTGNIVVSGTVDGRDLATDGSKLDGIESGATADQTQSEINALGITATGLSGTPNITVGTIDSGAIESTSSITSNTFIEIVGASGSSGFMYIYDRDNGTSNTDGLLLQKSGNNSFVYNRESSGSLSLGAGNTSNYLVIDSSGNIDLGTTQILDQSRNLTNIGTISSGNITASGADAQILATGDNAIALHQDAAWVSNILFGAKHDGSNQVYGASSRGAFKIVGLHDGDSSPQYLAIYGANQGTAGSTISWNTVGFVQDEDGKVGIGTTDPGSILHLYADNPQILFDDLGTQSSIAGQSGNILYKTSSTNRDHVFYGVSTEVARITGDANFSITGGNWSGADRFNLSVTQFDAGATFQTGEFLLFGDHDGTRDKMLALKRAGSDVVVVDSGGALVLGDSSAISKLTVIDEGEVNGEVAWFKGGASYGAVNVFARGTSYTWAHGIGGSGSTNANIPASYYGIEERAATNRPVRLAISHTHGEVSINASYSGSTFPFRVGYSTDGTLDNYTPTFTIDDNGDIDVVGGIHILKTNGGQSPVNYLNIQGATANNSNYPGVAFTGGTLANVYPYISLSNGGLALSLFAGRHTTNYNNAASMTLQGSTGDIIFFTNGGSSSGVEKMRLQSNGYLNVKDGILFGSDSAAANALDDYEEGEWTPTCPNVTLTASGGHYTKIGNRVWLTFYLQFPTTSNTNAVQINNLPFTVKNHDSGQARANGNRGGWTVAYSNSGQELRFLASSGTTTVTAHNFDGNTVNNNLISAKSIFGGGQYEVA